jgi:hypothetical protein
MNDPLRGKITTYIENSSFLTKEEREALLAIVPFWPAGELAQLEEVVRPSANQTGREFIAEETVNAAHGLSLRDLRTKLGGSTVAFSSKVQNLPTRPMAPRQNIPTTRRLPSGHEGEIDLPPAHISGRLPKPVVPARTAIAATPMPPPPRAIAPTMRPASPAPRPVASRPLAPIVPLAPLFSVTSSHQLSQISLPAMRSGRGFAINLTELLEQIPAIAYKEQVLVYSVIKEYEQSPLNQLFIHTGILLMDDPSFDRNGIFRRLQESIQAEQGVALTQKEFEMLTDFNDRLEALL